MIGTILSYSFFIFFHAMLQLYAAVVAALPVKVPSAAADALTVIFGYVATLRLLIPVSLIFYLLIIRYTLQAGLVAIRTVYTIIGFLRGVNLKPNK